MRSHSKGKIRKFNFLIGGIDFDFFFFLHFLHFLFIILRLWGRLETFVVHCASPEMDNGQQWFDYLKIVTLGISFCKKNSRQFLWDLSTISLNLLSIHIRFSWKSHQISKLYLCKNSVVFTRSVLISVSIFI